LGGVVRLMNLLSVEQVTRIWHCNRVTVLRLMRQGTLDWIEEDGEPLFDETEVLELKNPRIAIFPHLTISRREIASRQWSPIPADDWLQRYQQITAESEKLILEAKQLCANSRFWLAQSRQACEDSLAERRVVSQAMVESISFREKHRLGTRSEPALGTLSSP
jgi:hypothetical protein